MMDKQLLQHRRKFLSQLSVGLTGATLGSLFNNAYAAENYTVPGEEMPQTRVWMTWPSNAVLWRKSLPHLQNEIASLARTIAKYQALSMISDSEENGKNALNKIGSTRYPVTMLNAIPNDDFWLRDNGPIFRKTAGGALDCIDLNFNGWGGKQIAQKDTQVPQKIASYLGIPITKANIVGEGGGILQDGDGTLIATESCWVNDNRNPGKTRGQIEAELLSLFGAQKMIWCKGIRGGDITDMHIDASIQFVAPGKLLMHRPPELANDIWAQEARAMVKIISASTDAKGRKFEIHMMDEPVKLRSKNPQILRSYINYLAVNGAIISVNFGDDKTDALAKETFQKVYPGRVIEMLELDHLYAGGGGIHCVTQQQPVA
jgi:agmatine deiminase